ncbi:hypothetical protein ACQPZ2_24500 [Nocardia pseudovaccinii]|uniref:hypothetical protein n=1 Tax=Nocardia pseudovaccinii TaxID=189540 RepID=UPI003D8DE114
MRLLSTALRHARADEARGCGSAALLRRGWEWDGYEGRGVGLYLEAQAYRLEDEGLNTVEAFDALNLSYDVRRYSHGALCCVTSVWKMSD